MVLAGRAQPDIDRASLAVRKRVRDRIEKEIGQHLPKGTRIAVHREVRLAIDVEPQVVFRQSRPQIRQDVRGELAEIKLASIEIASINGDLLERLDQFGRAFEIAD